VGEERGTWRDDLFYSDESENKKIGKSKKRGVVCKLHEQ
jgi:hypothetical protein